jgi:hypothetical protein
MKRHCRHFVIPALLVMAAACALSGRTTPTWDDDHNEPHSTIREPLDIPEGFEAVSLPLAQVFSPSEMQDVVGKRRDIFLTVQTANGGILRKKITVNALILAFDSYGPPTNPASPRANLTFALHTRDRLITATAREMGTLDIRTPRWWERISWPPFLPK